MPHPINPSRLANVVPQIAQSANIADALFVPGEGDAVPGVVRALAAGGVNLKRLQLLGTGLWDDQRIFGEPLLQGGWYVAPDPNSANNFRAFAQRYRQRYGNDPARTATMLRMMTPDYASPEQVRGQQITAATDIYSLGAVLYELLTGARPHRLETYTPTEIERVVCEIEAPLPNNVATIAATVELPTERRPEHVESA